MSRVWEDRFTRGVLTGWIAGLVLIGWNVFSYYILHFSKNRLADFAGAMIFGKKAETILEFLFAQIAVLILCGFFGLVFAYLITWVSTKNFIFKGWFFSVFLWFSIYSIAKLYKVPTMMTLPLATAASNFIAVTLFGLVLAVCLRWMDVKAGEGRN